MAEPVDPTADRLLSDVWRSMRGALDAQPTRTLLQVSRVQVEFWADSVAGARLLLTYPASSHVERGIGLAVVGFLAGLLIGLYSH